MLQNKHSSPPTPTALAEKIRDWGQELGFRHIGFSGTDLSSAEPGLTEWLAAGCHGDMDYMVKHGMLRARPQILLPGTLSVISASLDYLPDAADSRRNLAEPERAFISRYALGRDYHKLLRLRLQKLADRIVQEVGPFAYRVFTDSAPLLEVELATRGGMGWRGKHTLLIQRGAGSHFFLGEILCALPLPADPAQASHCGRCRACLDACPTAAFIAPWRLDARRCISYLTIEHPGSIPLALRPLMGNRIYGCDDCQLVCPWNRFAPTSREKDFSPRHGLDRATLVQLFAWTEEEFRTRMAGSAILRLGHERWLRNIAVALGNAPSSDEIVQALRSRCEHPSEMLREHIAWALAQQNAKKGAV